ncbi:hypothetical protein [Herbidospora mongoliensis]|uniref:hypothetical protein n=1 Tax=Herbidospora mongoliensis TaxID=688067 RepID=UPI00082A6D6F|nr:hypothetical protein [Herbidospora mongoliensis]
MAEKKGSIGIPTGLLPTLLAAEIKAEVLDPNGDPGDIVPKGTDLRVKITWKLTGVLSTMIAGRFQPQARFNAIGATHNFAVAGAFVPAAPRPAGGEYTAEVLVAAATFTEPSYEVDAFLFFEDGIGAPGPITGKVDLESILFTP